MAKFQHGHSYPIETLPDDLHDETIPNRDRWAIKQALFWNDCQGWWMERVADIRRQLDFGQIDNMTVRFWSPLPPAPMTREQLLAERGEVICPTCDVAIDPHRNHACTEHQIEIVTKQRRLQAIADAQPAGDQGKCR